MKGKLNASNCHCIVQKKTIRQWINWWLLSWTLVFGMGLAHKTTHLHSSYCLRGFRLGMDHSQINTLSFCIAIEYCLQDRRFGWIISDRYSWLFTGTCSSQINLSQKLIIGVKTALIKKCLSLMNFASYAKKFMSLRKFQFEEQSFKLINDSLHYAKANLYIYIRCNKAYTEL